MRKDAARDSNDDIPNVPFGLEIDKCSRFNASQHNLYSSLDRVHCYRPPAYIQQGGVGLLVHWRVRGYTGKRRGISYDEIIR